MVICSLCNGFGVRSETIVEYLRTWPCTACDGTGKVPPAVAIWRPFEQTRENVQAGRKHNRCNRHDDCAAADAKARASDRGWLYADHCHDEGCEDCFGC